MRLESPVLGNLHAGFGGSWLVSLVEPVSHPTPLVHGSSPCGPTKYESRANARLFLAVDRLRSYALFFRTCPAPTKLSVYLPDVRRDALFARASANRSASHPFIARATVFGTGFSPLR